MDALQKPAFWDRALAIPLLIPTAIFLGFSVAAAPVFARMFADFGIVPSALTSLVLSTWFPLALAAIPIVAMVVAGLGSWLPITRTLRIVVVIVAFAISALALAVIILGLYLPVASSPAGLKP